MRHTCFVAAALLLTACSSTSAQPAPRQLPNDVVATVGAVSISLAQVDDKALEQPVANFGSLKLAQALYEARRSVVDELIANALFEQEAKSRGVEPSKLVEQEITSKVQQVDDQTVAAWYESNKSRVQGATLDQVRQPIRAYLLQERVQAARQQFVDTLKRKTPVRILLDPPRQKVAAANAESKGPKTAPIEIVEFSDFQCPYCQRANPTLNQVLSTYGDRIHFVYRHFPLPSHPNARPAAEASQCAAEQGKFWAYHDKLFANPSKLGDSDLRQHAVDLGLDASKFNACVDSHKFRAQVDADAQAGEEAGVNGTPAFFINGRVLSGAQPFEAFKRIIDDELALKR